VKNVEKVFGSQVYNSQMKTLIATILLLSAPLCFAQQKTYSVPEDQLTQEQKERFAGKNTPEEVHKWAGVGKEVGEAVNSSLQAITTQTDNFAKTGVGKVTIALVVWKVMGDQAVHLIGGFFEALVFIPLWIWSYRKTCMTRLIKLPDKTYKVLEYVTGRDEFTPRLAHTLAACGFVAIWLTTVFSY
jgi:hypothetical protein